MAEKVLSEEYKIALLKLTELKKFVDAALAHFPSEIPQPTRPDPVQDAQFTVDSQEARVNDLQARTKEARDSGFYGGGFDNALKAAQEDLKAAKKRLDDVKHNRTT
jgi:hypothetical protein